MKKFNILVFQPDFSQYICAYYQHDFVKALNNSHNIFRYGPKLKSYNIKHNIFDVLKICPFKPDLICFAAGWEIEDPNIPEFDPHPYLQAFKVSIPKVMILNKEYKKLEKKFQFIYDNKIQIVFTVHHFYKKWQKDIDVPLIHFPFAIDKTVFNDYGENKKYSLGFSGNLHEQYSDIRTKIKNHLFITWPIKRIKYMKHKIFWRDQEWVLCRKRILPTPAGYRYAQLINKSKMWISTPSAIDIVGCRFYEVMASKSLLFCVRHTAYGDLFKDGEHCIMFDSNLKDFDDKFFYYLDHESERQKIIDKGYNHVMENHTWEKRIEQFTHSIKELIS